MKARPVKKLDPAAPLSDNAARIVKVRLEELIDFTPKALHATGSRPSTTCGSRPSGCATCSR